MVITVSTMWRPVLALLTATGLALTLGVGAAQADDSDRAICSAGGYHADAMVKYRRAGSELYIENVSVNIDDQLGPRNRVKLQVKDGAETAFNYTSKPNVTAGPYLFDYSDNPIKLSPEATGSVRVIVAFTFDTSTVGERDESSEGESDLESEEESDRPASTYPFKRLAAKTCTATVTL